jgi:hypothetical protein
MIKVALYQKSTKFIISLLFNLSFIFESVNIATQQTFGTELICGHYFTKN